jgi:ribosomal protein L5
MPKFSYFFKNVILRDVQTQVGKNDSSLPRLNKIIVHFSFMPNFFKTAKVLPFCLFALEYLTGQKAVFSFSKKDVAVWRLRKKQLVSIYTTLRGTIIINFLEKFLFTFLIKNKFFKVSALQNNAVVYEVQDFITFSELERESINIVKNNAAFKNYRLCIIVVFAEISKQQDASSFFLNSFQFPTQSVKLNAVFFS